MMAAAANAQVSRKRVPSGKSAPAARNVAMMASAFCQGRMGTAFIGLQA